MAANTGASKLKLHVGSPRNINDTSSNQEHAETGAIDIEWQWTSPIGAVSNVKMRSGKRPIGLQQVKKQPAKSISPVSNDFPRKRKLIKSEEPVTKLESSEVILGPPDSLLSMYKTDSSVLAVGNNEYNRPTQCAEENYCALGLFDEIDDDCLMQCSQYVEETLSQNCAGITPLEATTPRSTRVHSVFPNTQTVNASLSFNKPKAAIKPSVRTIPSVETKVSANAQLISPVGKDSSPVNTCRKVQPPLNTSDQEASANSKKLSPCGDSTSKYEINDSFDEILMTCYDENFELLSQPTKCDQLDENIPLNVPLPTSNICSKLSVTMASESLTLIKPQPIKRSDHFLEPENELNLDDDFLQPDVLKLLETVEANSQHLPVSPTQHTCTPQEIENKRREAKMKLERKKLAVKSLGLTNLTRKMGNRM